MKYLITLFFIVIISGCVSTSKYGGDFVVKFGTIQTTTDGKHTLNPTKRILLQKGANLPKFGLRVENLTKEPFKLGYHIIKATPTLYEANYQLIEHSPEWTVVESNDGTYVEFIISSYDKYTLGDYIIYAKINGKTYRQIDYSIISG
ncbi:hypothetical protein [Litorilituus lipolyticus]|uniref:DUF4625 domain-containing protein n=1 Tax=Litorilituus lipolyticus TaxID=2491017 RepID=A0A502KU07_9GAMM|nr:hypothetical protein [Litorilituus lipolyticus]TPH13571.1 hypothetical protein EPA86_13285 [Litorilituus lipolyticus]